MTTPGNICVGLSFGKLLAASGLAAMVVFAGVLAFLWVGLPAESGQPVRISAIDFKFAFGNGRPEAGRMVIDEFSDGYALLTSGPVSVQAGSHNVLRYSWLPSPEQREVAFFWRLKDQEDSVNRKDIAVAGTRLIDLSVEPAWSGEVIEFGFLVGGKTGESVRIGQASLESPNLAVRLCLTWQGWTTFEGWSQQSINFLRGGDYVQPVSLPVLVLAWLFLSAAIAWISLRFSRSGSTQQWLGICSVLFLLGWILLDIRWAANNLRQTAMSLTSLAAVDEKQRLSTDLDGKIYQYVQRLKHDVLGKNAARILIIGGEGSIEYHLMRAKYHLLPHSVNVSSRFDQKQEPETLDFVIYVGQTGGLSGVPGFNRKWRNALKRVDSGYWGTVYRVDEG